MNTLLIILKIFPLVLAAVQAVEQAIPLPGQGNKKLELVLDVLKSAYDGSADLAKQFSWDKLVARGRADDRQDRRPAQRAWACSRNPLNPKTA